MIDLMSDYLVFSFPEVHPQAILHLCFQRTLRIPDDDKDYPLPPGLESFPTRLVDDFANRVPPSWLEHGGIMLPMFQSEAMWLDLDKAWVRGSQAQYPFAIKVAAGKINAVTGDAWSDRLHQEPQDYLVVPEQPWLDGFCVEEGVIRQFVAMPLGSGYSAEEQLTGEAEFGGLQIQVYPMKREAFERRFPKGRKRDRIAEGGPLYSAHAMQAMSPDMGLAPGGRMRQEIYDDPYSIDDWDLDHSSRCFVHLVNSLVWASITGSMPPSTPPTAKEYNEHGLPWFDYYSEDTTAVDGSKKLDGLDSVATLGEKKGDVPLPENESVTPERIVELRKGLRPGQLREGKL